MDALVSWPSAPLTTKLVTRALETMTPLPNILKNAPNEPENLIQWSSYDSIDHEITHTGPDHVLSSSFVIRKALIRKHYLARCIHDYLVKMPSSPLQHSTPRTWELDISFADELEEKWADELWDLGEELDTSDKWWILKPGMADRGMGIRLFNNKHMLESIFEEFEESEDLDNGDLEDHKDNTAVVTSQLRHFVIQEYIIQPLLLDPNQVPLREPYSEPTLESLKGHKFHLRAYCFAIGTLRVYLYDRILALFSSAPYRSPGDDDTPNTDLSPHLTNTCLQTHRGEEGVRLFTELVGCRILTLDTQVDDSPPEFTHDDIEMIIGQISEILAETFKAALQMSVHFQPLPNAFELYGVDFMIQHNTRASGRPRFQALLLEINAEPAIEMTGPRLTWILEDLFVSMAKICVQPFINRHYGPQEQNILDEGSMDGIMSTTVDNLAVRKVLDIKVRGVGGW